MTYVNENSKKETLTKIKIKIAELENKLKSIKEKLDESNNCSICYDDLENIENVTISPCCNTKYCFCCISKCLSIKSQCPFCRSNLSINSLIVTVDKKVVKKEENPLLSKIDNLKMILNKRRDNMKMLIFSDYNNSFNKIEELLNENTIKFSKIRGTYHSINKTIDDYKNGNTQVLLLNSDFCGSGINLENSTDIVIYHAMTKDKTTQVIGRGQRPGRNGVLNVWKLCYENEFSQFN